MIQNRINFKAWHPTRMASVLTVAFGLGAAAVAAPTDVAQVPLATSSATLVKPNVMFILDDSGSMGRDYMPDDANFSKSKYGFYASQCNGLAYNPTITYALPVTSTGTTYPLGTYTFPSPTNLNNVRTISSAAPAIATGSVTVTLSSGDNSSYSTGALVTLYSNSDTNKLMVGTVSSWNGSTRSMTVNVLATAGSGSLASPRIGDGANAPLYYNYTGDQVKLGYTYGSTGLVTNSANIADASRKYVFSQCDSAVGGTAGKDVFNMVLMTPTSADIQNYRNWYTYYRTRSLLMSSSASLAFKPIGDNYRVGFSTISTRRVSGSKFLDVADFDASHKSLFYSELFGAAPDAYTPLRGALSKAGKYFAKKATLAGGGAQTYDPMQYSCQRNYAILTTDGYWNTGDGDSSYDPGDEAPGSGADSYGPDKLDNTDVGQQDGSGTPRPMLDNTVTTVQERTSQLQQRTITPQWTTATSNLQQRSVTPAQTRTSALQARTTTLYEETSSNSGATWGPPTQVSICVWDTSGSTRTRCTAVAGWSAWSDVSSCTATSVDSAGTTWRSGVECQYAAWTAWSNTASCTAVAKDNTSPHNVGVARECTPAVYGAWTNVASCTASATNECAYTAPVNTTTASCTAVAPSAGPDYTVATAVACTAQAPLNGPWTNTSTCTASSTMGCQYSPSTWTAWSLVPSCVAAAKSTGPDYTVGTARECQTNISGGSSNTLADVAMYYYQTDLRTTALGNCTATVNGNSIDVCNNNVSPSGVDTALHQHMTTFTLGLGVSGTLRYQSDYTSAASGDFYDIKQGVKDWPIATGSTEAENIDDLWHAAVNGRGRYFNANDPTSLADSLANSLAAINATVGSGSGAAASTLQPVAGDNKLFIAKYKSVFWIGDLVARTIDPVTGTISAPVWSAATQLQNAVDAGTPRNIYYSARTAGTNTGTLRAFTDANLSTDGLLGNFANACSKTVALTQCATLTANKAAADAAYAATPNAATLAAQAAANAALASVNSGSDMVSYLRGGSNSVFRARVTTDTDIAGGMMGDIIGGAPVYVGQPSFRYTENDYAGFVAAVKATNSGNGRSGVAYVGSNDGMLHAIDGATGNEKWAYVPTMVMDRMYRLADKDYANRHEYFVNGAPVIGDIYVPGSPGTWKTILVAGLGAGGRGYYALDITNPDTPVALWEFTNDSLGGNDNLGLTFGNPVITKRADGTWVVAFSSGYNNILPGDGNGRLFMVNANTGQRVLDIPTYTTGTTPAGTTTTPSGLGKLNAWVDSEIDNTAKRFYGGDVLGNLWRFDTDNLVAPNQAALRMAYFSAGGVAQPITTQPSLAEVSYAGSRFPVVYVGTGKYLGSSDLTSTATQTVYAIKDSLTNTPLGDVHASPSVVAQTLSLPPGSTNANDPRNITNLPVNWVTDNGWRVDLITSTLPILGERVNVDMQLLYNTLTVAGNIPSSDVCDAGGSSYLYQFDIGTGSVPSTLGGTVAGRWLGGSMVVGISWVTLQAPGGAPGSGRTITITVDNKGNPRVDDVPPPPPPTAAGRRTSWRELVQ